MDGLRGRGSSTIWHHEGLALGSGIAQYVNGGVGLWPRR